MGENHCHTHLLRWKDFTETISFNPRGCLKSYRYPIVSFQNNYTENLLVPWNKIISSFCIFPNFGSAISRKLFDSSPSFFRRCLDVILILNVLKFLRTSIPVPIFTWFTRFVHTIFLKMLDRFQSFCYI